MNPDLAPYRDPELVATVERLRASGCSPETVAAAERYVDADAEFSRLLRMPPWRLSNAPSRTGEVAA